METIKYIALDVHLACIVIVVMNAAGRVVLKDVINTSVPAIQKFFKSLKGRLIVTFEEGTLSQWLCETIQPLADQVIVCNPRRNKLLSEGSKNDRIDTRKLADLLRTGMLKPVYHGQAGTGVLKELVRSYDALVGDTNRVMNRLKAVYRSRGIKTGGRDVYYKRNREAWLDKIDRPAKQDRAAVLYRQFDCLRDLRREAKRKMLLEARRHSAWKILRTIPGLGPIRVAIVIAIISTPHRFRSKRQLWKYSGLSVVTESSSDYYFVQQLLRRSSKQPMTRGLTREFNHLLKSVLKSASVDAIRKEPFKTFYELRISAGVPAEMARLIVARKIATLILVLWKRGVLFDGNCLLKAA
jgi:transposase